MFSSFLDVMDPPRTYPVGRVEDDAWTLLCLFHNKIPPWDTIPAELFRLIVIHIEPTEAYTWRAERKKTPNHAARKGKCLVA